MWNYYGGNMMGWGFDGWFMPFMMIVFWFALIALVVWAVRGFRGRGHSHGHAMEILKERYAQGEITKKEFETIKKDLE